VLFVLTFSVQEGWVVGGADQGGALRGSEGHRRWPLHVSSVGNLQHSLCLCAGMDCASSVFSNNAPLVFVSLSFEF
jgi:hypothetical protein